MPTGTILPEISDGSKLTEPELHISNPVMSETWGSGLTVIVKVKESPTLDTPPFVNVGVTVMEDISGSDVVFCAVNKFIIPFPSSVWVNPILSPEATHS